MGNQRPEPPPNGGPVSSDLETDRRYVLTYVRDENAHEADFEEWLLEWMLAWTEDPSVRRVDIEPTDVDGRDRVVIDTSFSDRVMPDRHRRLLREFDDHVAGLAVRSEPPMSTLPVGIERDRAMEVHG